MAFGVLFVIVAAVAQIIKLIYNATHPESMRSQEEKYREGYEARMERERKEAEQRGNSS